MNKLGSLKRRWTVGLTLLMGTLALGAGLGISHTTSRVALDGIAEQISACRELASAVRLVGIAALALVWPKLIGLLVDTTDARFNRLQALRWRATGWLFSLEIALGQNLLGRLLK